MNFNNEVESLGSLLEFASDSELLPARRTKETEFQATSHTGLSMDLNLRRKKFHWPCGLFFEETLAPSNHRANQGPFENGALDR